MKEDKMINGHRHILYQSNKMVKDIEDASLNYYLAMNQRRSIRHFSDKNVPRSVIENLILTASSAPSGAHKQPWHFCAISNPKLKQEIRIAAEKEEQLNYESRMSAKWLKDLEAMGTDMYKPFLEQAPWLIILFKRIYDINEDGEKEQNYYVNESVGIASGFLISAIHNLGLATLTHTPSPMNFLSEILKRPSNERPYLLFPVGYPAQICYVPDLERKDLSTVSDFYE